ncbi:hypothetical protein [Pseudomonas tolaasii]|uniref:hypothetical protein n=1 Tax=Pseudomonas tolaasii TaxID=29442 RepID=UPI002736EF04|nr:hypothetical protein [Pseudomonas tolaasii]WLH51487.1 hypothetical protein PSH62_26015 [Pseudomonas tolaasii]
MTNNRLVPLSLEQAISAQFASRPALADVAWRLLSEAILKEYPTIKLDPALTRVGLPTASARLELKPLKALMLDFLGTGNAPDFQDKFGQSARLVDEFLIIKLSPPEAPGTYPDMTLIQQMIVELPWTLAAALQNDLAAYWRDPADTGTSRWQWLSDRFRETLQSSAIEQAQLDDLERQAIDQLVRYPTLEQRTRLFASHAVHAYCPELVFTQGARTTRQLSPALLLVRSVAGQTSVLLCNATGLCEPFASVDAFTQTWGQRMAALYEVEHITLNRYEPDGNVFDCHAAAVLNEQLENLQTLGIPSSQGIETLTALYQRITDPGYYFLNPAAPSYSSLANTQEALPEWLQNASPADRIAYRQHSLALASAKKRSHGHTFLSDIADIHSFAADALLSQLKLDEARLGGVSAEHSRAQQFLPEDLQLTFIKAAGLPGAVGVTQRTTLNLVDLAIANLAGQPGILTTISHKTGLALPGWLTPNYITRSDGLIETVDIGKSYPDMLRQQLLGDDSLIPERETCFADQTAAQLPLLALELKLRGQNGLTERGVRCVCALLGADAQDRQVDGQAVVMRELALVRKAGAGADTVANMFIIEAQDSHVGPHLLYRPLYAEPLQEFATRPQLLQALAEPGALQTSVLTWLSDKARPIYDNGGFNDPHYVRFGRGSDFGPIESPLPATLAVDETGSELQLSLSRGKLMQYLYGSNARALVDQANRDSVSNHESRWAVLMEGANLLFSTLLQPFLRGPMMLTGWLISLMNSASHDIPALNSPDPITRELALVDLLMNVGMLLLQLPSATNHPPTTLGRDIQALQPPGSRRSPGQWPEPLPAQITEGSVTLAAEATGFHDTTFDFSFSSARDRLTPSQAERLASFQVPKPNDLPPAIASGPGKGLYEMNGNRYAQVDGHWYRIEIRPDNRVVIVLPTEGSTAGPWLKSDGDGHWSLDLNLRLRGGMPRSRIEAARQAKAARKAELATEFSQLIRDQQPLQDTVDRAHRAMDAANTVDTRRAFDAALNAQTQRYQQLLDSLKERRELQIPVAPRTVAVFLSNAIKNVRKSSHLASEDRLDLCAAHPEFFIQTEQTARQILAHKDRYAPFTRQLIEINERQIQALDRQDGYLQELAELGSPGADEYKSLTADRSEEVTALGVRFLQLQSLKFSLFKNLADFPEELSDILDPLGAQVRTHAELNRLELDPDDRLQTLESLNERYGQAVDALRGEAIVYADGIDMTCFTRVQKLVETLYLDTTRQLAEAIRPDAQPTVRPAKQPLFRQGELRKKIIKTRKQGVLIGEFKSASKELATDHVEVRSEQDKRLLATYTLQGDAWEEVRTQTPQPVTATRPLNILNTTAHQRLAELNQILAREERYAKASRFPVEIEESLHRAANRYSDLFSELKRAQEREKKPDRNLLDDLEKAATTLTSKGQELRIRASLALPPTHANLAYLLKLQKVQVARLGDRKPMRGERKDFIQEYAVNDRSGAPLWYAHFHYPNANTAEQSYTVAHLKTVQQRKESYYSLLAKSPGNQALVDVHRGLIGKDLAQHWFLPLAP